MPETALPVEFLFQMDAAASRPLRVHPGPQGDRLILAVEGGSFEGPRLRGELVAGPGSEWATVRADGTLGVDVRLVLRTHDDADILMTYGGVAVPGEAGLRIRTAPVFQTGDERYAWLNSVQAIGIGQPGGRGVVYDVYQLL